MISLSFDNGTVEQFTIVLSQRDYTHLGQISNIRNLKFAANLNSADELSFEVCKELDNHEEVLWDDIYDLRLIWVKELDEYFEIEVESTDQVYVVKTITAKSLCESELSQTYLHDIEINTAEDIARPDYDPLYPTVFYRPGGNTDEKLRKASLLHRILEKVPAYSIGHVDSTLMNLQRIFSISNTSIYDFLTGECADQFNCLFQFDTTTRTVSVYDLYTTCNNLQCPYYINENNRYYSGTGHKHYRGLFNDTCPYCGSNDITTYGTDTEVFVSTENLTDEVRFDTDVASLKNCFRLEAGDDNMTAAVINSNPNGTRYIYEFNAESKKDMPTELVNLIENYDVLYEEYYNTRNMDLNTSLISSFNALCNKYNNDATYHMGSNTWKTIVTPIYGYRNLIPHYYNCVDFYSYLQSSMMPQVIMPSDDIDYNISLLQSSLSTVGFSVAPLAQATIENAIVNLSKLYINTGAFKVKIKTTTSWSSTRWTGIITLTSYEDDSITRDTSSLTLTLTTDFGTFMDQKISKYIKRSKESTELYDVLKINDLTIFSNQLKLYSATRLQSFHDAIQAVLGILTDSDQGHDGYSRVYPNTTQIAGSTKQDPYALVWYEKNGINYVRTSDRSVNTSKKYYTYNSSNRSTLYDAFYLPYYNKLKATETELNTRNNEVSLVYGTHDANNNVQTKGVLQYILDSITAVQDALNFKEYIYNNTSPKSYALYNVYTTYIREDTYSNANYISDDLNNDQLFENAGRFLEVAKDELHKSATYQHSISSNINNLLAIDEFKPLLNKFDLGNWIRVKEDETIYRLRLISYSIDFDNLKSLNTEFSDVTITANGLNDIQSLLKQASSMASSYSYVQQQAETGSNVQINYIDDWVKNGLNSALIRINSNEDEDISIDNTGLLARSYDDINDTHDPEQCRVTHNVIAFTDDNWQSIKTALGKFTMTHHTITNDAYGGLNTNANAISSGDEYGLVANAVLAGWIVGSYMESSTIIGSHFQRPGNTMYIDMTDEITDDNRKFFLYAGSKFWVDKTGKLHAEDIEATIGSIGNWTVAPTTGSQPYGQGALYYLSSGGTMGLNGSALLSPLGYAINNLTVGQKRFGWTSSNGDRSKTFTFGVGNNFGVTTTGKLYASDAVVSGAIYASSGSFSGTISTNNIGITGTCTIGGVSVIGAGGSLVIPMANISGDLAATRIIAGDLGACTISSGKVSASTIDGATKFDLHADGKLDPTHISSLNWGDTWEDVLTVSAKWDDAGLGVCQEGYRRQRAIYIHYDDIEWYDNQYSIKNPWFAQFSSTDPRSDIRLKKNIKDINYDTLKQLFIKLRPIYFDYINGESNQIGLIAQELLDVLKELNIDDTKYMCLNKDNFYKIDYTRLFRASMLATHYLFKETDSLQTQIDILRQEINRLKGENNG